MRQLTGIGLFVLFAFLMVGIYPMQWALRHMARREARAMIRARGNRMEGLVSFTFHTSRGEVTDPAFAWEEEDEFTFHGHLYDVVDQHVDGDRITFHCLPDAEEDGLTHFARLLDPFRHRHRSSPVGSHAFIKLIADLFLTPQTNAAGPGSSFAHAFAPARGGSPLAGYDRALLRPPSA